MSYNVLLETCHTAIFKTACGPVLDYVLYYFDLGSDATFAVTMVTNCHFKVCGYDLQLFLFSYIYIKSF